MFLWFCFNSCRISWVIDLFFLFIVCFLVCIIGECWNNIDSVFFYRMRCMVLVFILILLLKLLNKIFYVKYDMVILFEDDVIVIDICFYCR